MSPEEGGFVIRMAARTLVAALLLAMTFQFLALSTEQRGNLWLTGSLCIRTAETENMPQTTAFAAALPTLLPENKQSPKNASDER